MITSDGAGGSLIAVKVVPGASRDAIAGALGNRLKIKVSAPPEGGKANQAVCALVAEALGLRPRDVELIAGHTAPEKTLRAQDISPETARALLT